MDPDKVGLAIEAAFKDKLPEGVEFVSDDGNILRPLALPQGLRYVGYMVKIQGTKILYQPIVLHLTDLASTETVYRKVMVALTEFRAALLAGTAKTTEDGGLLELDDTQQDIDLIEGEDLGDGEYVEESEPEKHE